MSKKRSRDETTPTSGTARRMPDPRAMHMGHNDVLHHGVFTHEPSRAVRATEPGVEA